MKTYFITGVAGFIDQICKKILKEEKDIQLYYEIIMKKNKY
jgi:hypothetical protein